ncbi:hypothetical protein E3N88_03694 [Mikania micrantha]|uniref:Exocyst subunit Exo70 family protein n=1 Tax=Mikania micrantha TaxID=192012 RepID=A0A5N6PU81_9ASTR|nr:hypothetical protein E3N88_03694 [Mikania micrantha]
MQRGRHGWLVRIADEVVDVGSTCGNIGGVGSACGNGKEMTIKMSNSSCATSEKETNDYAVLCCAVLVAYDMEKHGSKSGSFIGRHRWRHNLEASPSPSLHYKSPQSQSQSQSEDDEPHDHHQIFAQLDDFISTADDKTNPPEITHAFSTIIKHKTRKSAVDEIDDDFLYQSVQRLCKLKTIFSEHNIQPSLAKVEKLLHRIMIFMEEQLRSTLASVDLPPQPKLKAISSKHFSFKSAPQPEPSKLVLQPEDYPGFSQEDIHRISKIVSTMIHAGYKNECLNVYSIARGNALYEQLRRLDFEKLNAEDVHKLNWDWLEPDISRWIKIIKHFSQFLIPAERRLGDTQQPAVSEDMDMDKSPLAAQIASVMSLLDGNLAVKSTLYKDPSLRDIFMMNNGRYILQKVKGSKEIKRLMGDNWCRRRSSEVRHYHKNYQRETWARLLQCITTQEGIVQGGHGGKVNKQVLKERFKNFNSMFDEIHKTQTAWVVSDDQLQSELRASISAVVIPAYRSFVGRYKHHLEAGKNMDKYIKYQPEDIEACIETLFEGNPPTSMSRKRF